MSESTIPHVRVRTWAAALLTAALVAGSAHAEAQGDPRTERVIAQLEEYVMRLLDLEPAVANLQATVQALEATVRGLEARIALLEPSGAAGTDNTVELDLGTPGLDGSPRPPGSTGYEVLDALQQRLPELLRLPGTTVFVDQDRLRVRVPMSAEGVQLLESPAFTQFLGEREGFSGSLPFDVRDLPLRDLQGSFNIQVSPDGLQNRVEFEQTNPAAFQELIRRAAPGRR